MTLEEAAGKTLGALTASGVPHMLVGGFTSNYYGIPRATKDVDIVIHLADRRQLSRVAAALGPEFEFDPQVTFETITGNVRHIIRLLGTPFVIELFELSEDPFQQQRFERRVTLSIPQLGQIVSLPTAEDVVVQKIRWGRPKDLEDARDVLAVQGDNLQLDYIEMWCERHGTLDRLRQLLADMPPL